MARPPNHRKLLDDCFLNDKERMRHHDVLALLHERLCNVTAVETIDLNDAHNRVLAENIVADIEVPGTDNAAVDGFAFAFDDLGTQTTKLPIVGTLAAGQAPIALAPKSAIRIFTGAPIPEGADTVIMSEDAKVHETVLEIGTGLKRGANRRKAGEDLKPGDTVLHKNRFLRPADIAALASVGIAKVPVKTRLRVGLLSTGDEIAAPGQPKLAHQVYDANKPMLRALSNHAAIDLVDLGHAHDDAKQLSKALSAASRSADLIITTGGASRGDEDHMLNVLDEIGKRHLWQIAIKPGRPMMFGQIGDCVIVALPGNPVAAMVCHLLYVRPVMALLMGVQPKPPRAISLPSAFTINHKKPDRREFLRAWIDPQTGMVEKFGRDGSGLISGLVSAGGLVEIGEEVTAVKNGDLIDFIPFSHFQMAAMGEP